MWILLPVVQDPIRIFVRWIRLHWLQSQLKLHVGHCTFGGYKYHVDLFAAQHRGELWLCDCVSVHGCLVYFVGNTRWVYRGFFCSSDSNINHWHCDCKVSIWWIHPSVRIHSVMDIQRAFGVYSQWFFMTYSTVGTMHITRCMAYSCAMAKTQAVRRLCASSYKCSKHPSAALNAFMYEWMFGWNVFISSVKEASLTTHVGLYLQCLQRI